MVSHWFRQIKCELICTGQNGLACFFVISSFKTLVLEWVKEISFGIGFWDWRLEMRESEKPRHVGWSHHSNKNPKRDKFSAFVKPGRQICPKWRKWMKRRNPGEIYVTWRKILLSRLLFPPPPTFLAVEPRGRMSPFFNQFCKIKTWLSLSFQNWARIKAELWKSTPGSA